MYEYVGNLHVHTTYSDGAKTHAVVAASAIRAGLDFVITTDHNVLVRGVEGYYGSSTGQRVLLLTGQEVHDMVRRPQKNHLLVYGTGVELAPVAQGQPPQNLLDAIDATGGICFIAHPVDRAVGWAGEGSYGWVEWDINGFTGLELWNYMSSIKSLIQEPVRGIRRLLDPAIAMTGPEPETLQLWDDLLAEGLRVAVVGSADAHAGKFGTGPFRRTLYPYETLFRAVNTHVLLDGPLGGNWQADGNALYRALGEGHAFVGYSVPGSPRGFRFEALQDAGNHASGENVTAIMGDAVPLSRCDTLRVTAPAPARLRLLRDGEVVAEQEGVGLTFAPQEAGAYRVEAWKTYRGAERGWVFTNPIYVTEN